MFELMKIRIMIEDGVETQYGRWFRFIQILKIKFWNKEMEILSWMNKVINPKKS